MALLSHVYALCITESWLSTLLIFLYRDLIYSGKIVYSSNGAGVCLYLNSSYPRERLNVMIQVLRRPNSLPRSISSIIICVVYHSMANTEAEHIILCKHVQFKQPNALVIISGDFNLTTGLDIKQPSQTISEF